MEKKGVKIAAQNRKAHHDYYVEDRYEVGIELAQELYVRQEKEFDGLEKRLNTRV